MLRKQFSEVSELQVINQVPSRFLSQSFETALTSLILGHSVLLLPFQTLNTELSKKLELQTQRLELVIAQHMANIVKTDAISYNKEQENYFVDEGDEVCIIDFCIKV